MQTEYDRVLECFEEKGVEVSRQEGVMAPPADVPADIVEACDADAVYHGPPSS